MRQLLTRLRRKLLNVPLWVKMMGIVVGPLLLVSLTVILYIRHTVLATLLAPGALVDPLQMQSFLTRQILLVMLLTAGLGVGLAYGFSRLIIHPLQQLLQVIQGLEAGDLEQRVDVWADDELGQVQAAFNHMAARLEQMQTVLVEHNYELSVVNDLTQEVSLAPRIDSVIEASLARVRRLLDAEIAFLYCPDPNRLSGQEVCIQGDLPAAAALALGQAWLASGGSRQDMVRSGKTIAFNHLYQASEMPGKARDLLAEHKIISWMCTPVQGQDSGTGSLNVARRSLPPFNQADQVILAAIANVMGIGMSRAGLLEDLQRTESELRGALRRLVELQEDERKHLARELHDETSQALTSILIRLRTLQEETDLETIQTRLDGMRYLTAQTIEELRRIAMDLHPAALDNLGILPALRWYLQRTQEQAGFSIQFHAPEKMERLQPEIELTLYRIAQEAVTNAIRHANASKIEVSLDHGPRGVWLEVSDDGQGFDPSILQRGLGLVGIGERVALVHGRCGIDTSPGKGARLWVEIST